MHIDKGLWGMFLLLAIFLSACSADLSPYDKTLGQRIYGAENLASGELENINKLLGRYAQCLLDVDGEADERTAVLKEIAPEENPDEWTATYQSNETVSKLLQYQALDLNVIDQGSVIALMLCQVEYQDKRIEAGRYLFMIRATIGKQDENWIVHNSEVLGVAKADEVEVVRDDITNQIKFQRKEVTQDDEKDN